MRKWEVIAKIGMGASPRRKIVEADSMRSGIGVLTFFIADEPVCQIHDCLFWEEIVPEPELWYNQLDEREMKAVQHARSYAAEYSEAGAPGHSHMMLISKLCLLLEGETL